MLTETRQEELPAPVTDDRLESIAGLNHGFFTRKGGVSTGLYQGLNTGLGSRDARQAVIENRARAAKALGVTAERLTTPHQTHSATAIIVDRPFDRARPEADGIVTATPELAIGVQTADCGPVLFAEPERRIIGACHAGWKGATGGVLEATVERMVELGAVPSKIVARLGPMISQKNYEVGPEFVDRLIALNPKNRQWLKPSEHAGHALFDLANYIVARLAESGVDAAWTGECTYGDAARFFSYRRTTHRNEDDYGRQLSAIAVLED